MKHNARPSFLIVSLRYIGDVLLATPLALSIKKHIPEATVDFLVFAGTEGVLAKNPLIRKVHTIPAGSKSFRPMAALWRQYDYAIATIPSDRATLFTAAAGRRSIGFSYFRRNEWWKRLVLNDCHHCDDRQHLVPLLLSQLEVLGIPPVPRVVMGIDESDRAFVREHLGNDNYIVLHPYSRCAYKFWPAAAWGKLAGMLREAGARPLFTVSPAPDEQRLLAEILATAPPGTESFPEPFSLSRVAAAIETSRGFVGVDTVVTHMAAALDVPTIALYGPTLVRHWGPWPNDFSGATPYRATGGVQRQGNITVVQKDLPCVPCNRENCAISGQGRIECLATLTAEEIFNEIVNGTMSGFPAELTERKNAI